MWPNPQIPADLVTFAEKILNGKLQFLCSIRQLTGFHCINNARIRVFTNPYSPVQKQNLRFCPFKILSLSRRTRVSENLYSRIFYTVFRINLCEQTKSRIMRLVCFFYSIHIWEYFNKTIFQTKPQVVWFILSRTAFILKFKKKDS